MIAIRKWELTSIEYIRVHVMFVCSVYNRIDFNAIEVLINHTKTRKRNGVFLLSIFCIHCTFYIFNGMNFTFEIVSNRERIISHWNLDWKKSFRLRVEKRNANTFLFKCKWCAEFNSKMQSNIENFWFVVFYQNAFCSESIYEQSDWR